MSNECAGQKAEEHAFRSQPWMNWVHGTVGTSTNSHPAGARPGPTLTSWGAVCVDFLHLTGRLQFKHFWFHRQVNLNHYTKAAYVETRNSITMTSVLDSRLKRAHFDHNNDWVHWTVGTSTDSHHADTRPALRSLSLSYQMWSCGGVRGFNTSTGRAAAAEFVPRGGCLSWNTNVYTPNYYVGTSIDY